MEFHRNCSDLLLHKLGLCGTLPAAAEQQTLQQGDYEVALHTATTISMHKPDQNSAGILESLIECLCRQVCDALPECIECILGVIVP